MIIVEIVGLFGSAILESGSSINQFARHRAAREFAFKTASFIDENYNNDDDSNKLLEFLLNVSARDLDQASRSVNNWVSTG